LKLILFSSEPLRAFGYASMNPHFTARNLTTRFAGNTSDQDSDREPEPPTKTIDKATARHGKRDAPATAPAESTGVGARGRGGRRGGGFSGSEAGNEEIS
jgi:hypothetical protein